MKRLARVGICGAVALGAACGGNGGAGGAGGSTSSGSSSASSGSAGGASSSSGSAGGAGGASSSSGSSGMASSSGSSGGGGAGGAGGVPSGWLYTLPGDSRVHVSGGVWMGRGVNMDDLFLCGYNYGLWMTSPDGEQALLDVVDKVMTGWKPTFVRVSLGMNSYAPTVGWGAASAYATSMTKVVNALGAHPGTYVLVTLRSDTTMVDPGGNPCGQADDAVCLPTSATDDVYRALVTSFQDAPYVLFGVSNEPGGLSATDQDLRARMDHAVSVIRAREDALGVPHHLVSVQGNQWTSKIGFYAGAPLPYDNVVYEYHSYPPDPAGYTQGNLPVIIGEYGPLGADSSFAAAFHADVEAKQIPNLAWDLAPYSDCAPDLVQANHTSTLTTTPWGDVVKAYLLAH